MDFSHYDYSSQVGSRDPRTIAVFVPVRIKFNGFTSVKDNALIVICSTKTYKKQKIE